MTPGGHDITTHRDFVGIGITRGGRFDRGLLTFLNIPVNKNFELPTAAIHSGVAYLHDLIRSSSRYDNMAKFYKDGLARRERRLKNLTLYVPDMLFAKGVSPEEFAGDYNYKTESVSLSEWSDVILNHREGAAYTMVVSIPTSNGNYFAHMIMNASTGQLLSMVYNKAGFSLGPVKLSGGQSFDINKKMAKLYSKIGE